MAVKFLEPGGDATFNVATTATGGLWDIIGGTPALATDFVHGSHLKSIRYKPAAGDIVRMPIGTVADAGARISFYIYIAALPSATTQLFLVSQSAGTIIIKLQMTTAGVIQLATGTSVQIGANGSTLSTGVWYRISIAYTITSTTVNEFRVFKNGVLDITGSNVTLGAVTSAGCRIGNLNTNSTLDFRSSDHYVDDSNALTDPGDIWVTAKRPFSNGTTNGFTTQIGAGGSGYGTGHSSQVNERALSNTNGWSMVGAGSAVTEEYNIEGASVGDIDISAATIIDWLGWIDTKSLAGETVQIILDGVNNAQAITSTETIYTKVKGSATYPSGTGADIGMITDTSLTTVSLYECGIIVAFIPPSVSSAISSMLPLLGAG